jgi:hypothetical protein
LKKLSRRQRLYLASAAQALLAGIAIGFLVYTGVLIGSSYLKNQELEQAVRKEAMLAATDSRPAETIRDEILQKSRDLGLSVGRGGIVVASSRKEAHIPVAGMAAIVENGSQNDLLTVGSVSIDVWYVIPIPFPLYTFQLKLRCHGDDHTL